MASYRGGHSKNLQLLKIASCKRCGSNDVAWIKSSKGKWYLVEGAYFAGEEHRFDGLALFSPFKFHSCKTVRTEERGAVAHPI